MNLPESTVVPCVECPWRRVSAPGWLGPFDVQEWVSLAHSEEPIACHMTIREDESWDDEDESWDDPNIRQCAGAARYRKNVCKMPRDPQVAYGPLDREAVFATPREFLEHHTIKEEQ